MVKYAWGDNEFIILCWGRRGDRRMSQTFGSCLTGQTDINTLYFSPY